MQFSLAHAWLVAEAWVEHAELLVALDGYVSATVQH
jgi:hypothetical protein